MTAAAIEPEPVPLVRDSAGRLMVPGTRISLDVLVAAFNRGKTPEAIHDGFGTISLGDVYAIFTYYLRHRPEVEKYLEQQIRQDTEVQAGIEAVFPISEDSVPGSRLVPTHEAQVLGRREHRPRPRVRAAAPI